jgi:hypothetical protein
VRATSLGKAPVQTVLHPPRQQPHVATHEGASDEASNWLRYDPVLVADRRGGALNQLKTLWLDCGDHDQFRIHFGMRRLHRKLEAQGVAHIYEEFDDDHTDVDYRMNRFLPVLAKALSA